MIGCRLGTKGETHPKFGSLQDCYLKYWSSSLVIRSRLLFFSCHLFSFSFACYGKWGTDPFLFLGRDSLSGSLMGKSIPLS